MVSISGIFPRTSKRNCRTELVTVGGQRKRWVAATNARVEGVLARIRWEGNTSDRKELVEVGEEREIVLMFFRLSAERYICEKGFGWGLHKG